MSVQSPNITRRAAAAGLGLALSPVARAQDTWPKKPVRLIMPYAPGGAGDSCARPWADKLSLAFGVPFVEENRGGASGTIGAEAVAKSPPDGSTFLITPNSSLNVLPQLRKVGYNPRKDFVPVARVGDLIGGFCILSSLGVKTVADMVAYAKQNPGKLVYGSSGLGTSAQMRIETLKLRAGVDILHVPYRGSGDAMIDLLSGSIHIMNEVVTFPHVKAGKLNLLAINHSSRHWDFPDTPILTEAGFPNMDIPIWLSVWAPGGTSKEIADILHRKIVEIARTEDMMQRMRAIGFATVVQTQAELAAFFEADWDANAAVIREAKITLT